MKNTLAAFALLLMVAACGKTEKAVYSPAEIVLEAEGPLFDGSNTAQASWKADLSEALEGGKLAGARLTSVTITAEEPADLALISDITLQFAGSGVAMQKVAFLNPLPDGSSSVQLQVADDQKGLADFFALSDMTLVADLNLKGEYEGNMRLKAKLEFSLDVSSK
ncbi:MAG: hypothetical protein C0424_02720 [Sphingobacteriaceae bacterium]|nr:hypothetical protein [Sphingobacteriaceae bacterium]